MRSSTYVLLLYAVNFISVPQSQTGCDCECSAHFEPDDCESRQQDLSAPWLSDFGGLVGLWLDKKHPQHLFFLK